MKYIKCFEDFNLNDVPFTRTSQPHIIEAVKRLNNMLNLIGFEVTCSDAKPEHKSSDDYTIHTDLNQIKGSLLSIIINSKEKYRDGEIVYIIDNNGFQIDNLKYYVSSNKEILSDPTRIVFKAFNANSIIRKLLNFVMEHFKNCTDVVRTNISNYTPKLDEVEIEGIGKFIEQYLKINRKCENITITRNMAKFFIKFLNNDHTILNSIQKEYPLVFNTIKEVGGVGIVSSDKMGEMGF